MHVPQT